MACLNTSGDPHHVSLFKCLPIKGNFFPGQHQVQMLKDISCLPTLSEFLSPAKEKYKVITGQQIFVYPSKKYDVLIITSTLMETGKI